MESNKPLTTGISGLDSMLKGVIAGDNIVWQVDAIEDYSAFVKPFCEETVRQERRLVYFRFARHAPLVRESPGVEIHRLDTRDGFENFIARIHAVIEKAGRGAFYVFDCLSELAVDWYSDQMLGNFFMLTCPYLYDMETVAYFALFRNYHSAHAIGPITETTQLFLDVYRHDNDMYVHPVKVQYRYSPTMHMLHVRDGDDFAPVTSSAISAEILTKVPWTHLDYAEWHGSWEKKFLDADAMVRDPRRRRDSPEEAVLLRQIAGMIISRDDRMLELICRHLTIEDVLRVKSRMIGSGLIGGKAVGMLLARAILGSADSSFPGMLEEHDSFFIGSDVFYTFLVRNGIWWMRQKQRNADTFLEGAEHARLRMLTGKFPDYTVAQIEEMLDYFGQSPIIVRSSSLLEDNFGNSFAGKYDSVFCPNQGPRERRIEDFLSAVRTIYASTMSERALHYRAGRQMLDKDEQMALLVMRVSGTMYGRCFYPAAAGVGFSFNPYVWHESIDPAAGVLRLVFGLGTRAVNRSDDDYTRVVALNAPEKRPESGMEEVRRYAQHKSDYLDLDSNRLVSDAVDRVIDRSAGLPTELVVSDGSSGNTGNAPVITFDGLLGRTDFVSDMRRMLAALERAYQYPVDIEYTVNLAEDGKYRINLVQCRPLQVKGDKGQVKLPDARVAPADCLIEARGAVIGYSRLLSLDWLIVVSPSKYGRLSESDRHAVARLIGRINSALPSRSSGEGDVLLIGPGRWGTTTPSLGVPVSFAEISRVTALCEVVAMRDDFVPDVSLGTHFLNELVEMDMLYLALFPDQKGNRFDEGKLACEKNILTELVSDAGKWKDLVRVVRTARAFGSRGLFLRADALKQHVLCYIGPGSAGKSPVSIVKTCKGKKATRHS